MAIVRLLVTLILITYSHQLFAGNACVDNKGKDGPKWQETKRQLNLMRDTMKCEGLTLKQCRQVVEHQSPYERIGADVGAAAGLEDFRKKANANDFKSNSYHNELRSAVQASKYEKEEEIVNSFKNMYERANPEKANMVREYLSNRSNSAQVLKLESDDMVFRNYLHANSGTYMDPNSLRYDRTNVVKGVVQQYENDYSPETKAIRNYGSQYSKILSVESDLSAAEAGKIAADKSFYAKLAERLKTNSTVGKNALAQFFDPMMSRFARTEASSMLSTGARVALGGAKLGAKVLGSAVVQPIFFLADSDAMAEGMEGADENQSRFATRKDKNAEIEPLINQSGFQIKTREFLMQSEEVQYRELASHGNFCDMFKKSYDDLYPDKLWAQCSDNKMTLSGDNEQSVWNMDWDSKGQVTQVEKTTAFDPKNAYKMKLEDEEPTEVDVVDYNKIKIGQKNKRPSFSNDSWPVTKITTANENSISDFEADRIKTSHRNSGLYAPLLLSAQKCCENKNSDSDFCQKLNRKAQGNDSQGSSSNKKSR